jgi:hypothetical protein
VWRREASVDFLTPAEANLSGLPDLGVLDLAAAENRILVSHDVRTIPSPLAEFLASNKSAGVLRLSQRMNIGEAITSLIGFGRNQQQRNGKTVSSGYRSKDAAQ